jgi:TRAP-type C4-dicarboxylate transport system substrate-binding protein
MKRAAVPTVAALARFAVALLVAGLVTAAAPAGAADEHLIRVGTLAPQGSPWHDVLLQVREDWRRISGGAVNLRIYSGVLGDESEMILKMRVKQVQAVAISGAALPRIDSGIACLQVPLMIESYEELDYVVERITPRLEALVEKRGFKILFWSDAGWVHFFTKKPAATVADLRALKMLTSAGDPETEKLYKDFGFKVVPLPYTEVLMGLETGLIEAVQGPPLYAMLDQWFGLARNMTDLRWTPLVGATVIRKDAWDAIPTRFQGPMIEAARAAPRKLQEKIRRMDTEAVPEMVKRGLRVVAVDDRARAAWRTEAEAAYPKLRGRYTPAELFDEVRRLRDEFRARSARPATPPAPAAPGSGGASTLPR